MIEYGCNPAKYSVIDKNGITKVIMNSGISHPLLPALHIMNTIIRKHTIPSIIRMKKNNIYDYDGLHTMHDIIDACVSTFRQIELIDMDDKPNAYSIKFHMKPQKWPYLYECDKQK